MIRLHDTELEQAIIELREKGKELGIALSTAIQSELLKQKRPGGILA